MNTMNMKHERDDDDQSELKDEWGHHNFLSSRWHSQQFKERKTLGS